MLPEPEEFVEPPKPEVEYSPLEGTEVQSALAPDEVDEAVEEGTSVDEVDSPVDKVGSSVGEGDGEDEVVSSTEEVDEVADGADGTLVEVDESPGQTVTVEVVVIVVTLSPAWRRTWPSWRAW